ncbi:MAG: CDP-glycerol glycerophosphotransferase family protein [Candidatus Wildermuthbacteria bacterium]|nr:CDP-glycerol glycerophosphotransferase family protein [Candidatus Wildermuthbacteria bacterium]
MVNSKIGKHIARLLTHPVLFLVYALAHLFPRDKHLWVFGIPKKFTWNSKYLFLYLANNKEREIRYAWISRDRALIAELSSRGYPAYFWLSPKGMWLCARAGFYIIDASMETINFWLSGGAKEVMMWHGIPLKKIERDIKKGESVDAKVQQSKGFSRFLIGVLLPWVFRKPDYIAATSPVFQEIFAGAFGVDQKNVFVAGFPKNDVYFANIPGAEMGADKETLLKLRELKSLGSQFKTILYAPTWRDTGGDSFFEKPDDLKSLDDFLQSEQLIFFLKLHPLAQKSAFASLRGARYQNIVFVNPDSDADPLLSYVDILVTDYSGIYFEFLLLNRPIVFFPFDYQKYVTRDRELYFDYQEVTPGPKVSTLEGLMQELQKIAKGQDEYRVARKKVKDMCYLRQDGKAAECVRGALKQLIDKA